MKAMMLSVLAAIVTLGATLLAIQLDTGNDWLAWVVVSTGSALALGLGSVRARRRRCCEHRVAHP